MKQILTPIQRRRLWAGARVVLLTYVAVFAQSAGYLARLEHVLYDQRVALCQHYTPPPTTSLVHLDIDDTAVAQVGRWPWHRDVMAEILEEVRLAEPKVFAMDVLFAEPDDVAYDRNGRTIDRDAILTDEIRKFGRVLVPASFTFEPPAQPNRINRRLVELLAADLELTPEQCATRLRAEGIKSPAMAEQVSAAYLRLRPDVLYERIHDELAIKRILGEAPTASDKLVPAQTELGSGREAPPCDTEHASAGERQRSLSPVLGEEGRGEGSGGELRTSANGPSPQPSPPSTGETGPEQALSSTGAFDAKGAPKDLKSTLRRKLLPHSNSQFTTSVLDRLFDEEYQRVVRERALSRFTIGPDQTPAPILHASNEVTPILQLSDAAAFSAFVDFLPDQAEGTVRRVPLMASYRGRLVPHMGLATACAMLGVDVHDLRLGKNTITIPRKNAADIVIPVNTLEHTAVGPVGYLLEVPMFGKRGSWQTMYDYPRHESPAQHVSVYEIWRIVQTRRRIASNEKFADGALVAALSLTDPAAAGTYYAAPLRGEPQRKLIVDTLANMRDVATGLAAIPDADLGPNEKKLLKNLKDYDVKLSEILKQNDILQKQLTDLRADLRTKLNAKAIFLGGTATGHVDQFPTSLHAQCPGVVVHGAIVNSILTGKMWRVAPPWVTALLTALLGILMGIIASAFSPAKAFIAGALLGCGYLAVNGYVLFDYCSLIVGASGPAFAVGLVWSSVTLFDFITESSERARITKRFSNYVDPSLVNYVIEHRDHARFDGEAREMTMGFTDLAGFTTLTESLGPRTVPLLSEYMNHMIPAIRAQHGYVSRLMGDGIYFFFGAPEPDDNHAVHAVNTILTMHERLAQMNLTLPQRDYPLLQMRAGLCTGRVIVGDAGSKEFSDYTAVGDSVNTAARLESANKFLGTKALVSARTIELLNGQFLTRPIGCLRVAGKTKGVVVYEPLSAMQTATAEQHRLAELSVQVVSTFQCGNFQDCVSAADQLEKTCGSSKFTSLYRTLSLQYQESIPDDFDGQIVFAEK